jgi:tRNA threonylcarbamoyladenosine modification (KEOPS) complex  Pcc1 subunit
LYRRKSLGPDEERQLLRPPSQLKRKSKKRSLPSRKLHQKTRKREAPAELSIEIGLPSSRFAETIYNSILPETRHTPGHRSRAGISCRGRILRLNIRAEDIVALRAASNTFLRFISVAMKTLNLISPFYSKDEPNPIQPTTGK